VAEDSKHDTIKYTQTVT